MRSLRAFGAAVAFLLLLTAGIQCARGQDGIDAGLYIDGKLIRLLPENCMVLRNAGVPWGDPPGGYALQFGAPGQPQSGRVYVQPGGVTVVLPEIYCVDRLFTNGFEE
jgi:hypothetical protein